MTDLLRMICLQTSLVSLSLDSVGLKGSIPSCLIGSGSKMIYLDLGEPSRRLSADSGRPEVHSRAIPFLSACQRAIMWCKVASCLYIKA